ncbi:Sugar kinase of the NBD/HSP70 family, may contain an N-terminal HTH domain [Streptomyces zhaozhouensis]|uniref:Sugar kinase of the NBD/HSP70 family, may contain an N-terminal HTH domain n=1 Tax=Streptomyces zhaozhouensis TaxID=1300267 RepID=A0A286DUV8_9ACTN|nr:ROK family transcriptional regulator [Streptomyces zhaozhouensis]SOD62428.1 Sugar kinase of the NBD/HSP70 family, may contain an N-terminal HTH domain [Streptomyces zhaozhouensis]
MADEARKHPVRDLRRANRAALLRQLYFHGPLSRHELGLATGLSSGTVSNVTGGLLADGLLAEAGSVESDGGRPRTLLRVAPDCGRLVGVDVGETGVRVALYDVALTELARAEFPLLDGGRDVGTVVGHIGAGVAAVARVAAVALDELLGVGVGVPGIVERAPGVGAVVHAATVGWDAVPLESLSRAAIGLPPRVPLRVANGARTFGQAETWYGAGRGSRDAVIVLWGSGVGACIVAGGAPYGGTGSAAGEFGHTTLRLGGRRCRCGAFGCLEAYVGAWGLLERWAESGGAAGGADHERGVSRLREAAESGDPDARRLLAEAAEFLGAGVSDLINLFNPERIVIGGWAGLALGPRLLPQVRRVAESRALPHPARRVTIELGRLGPDAVTVGAATLPLADFLAGGGSRGTAPAGRRAVVPGRRGRRRTRA